MSVLQKWTDHQERRALSRWTHCNASPDKYAGYKDRLALGGNTVFDLAAVQRGLPQGVPHDLW